VVYIYSLGYNFAVVIKVWRLAPRQGLSSRECCIACRHAFLSACV